MTTVTQFTTLLPGPATHEAPARRPVVHSKADPFRQRQPSHRGPSKKPHQDSPSPPRQYINWPNVIWLVIVHTGCLAAPFFFSWQAVLLTVVLHWITGGIGICLGFHRHLT